MSCPCSSIPKASSSDIPPPALADEPTSSSAASAVTVLPADHAQVSRFAFIPSLLCPFPSPMPPFLSPWQAWNPYPALGFRASHPLPLANIRPVVAQRLSWAPPTPRSFFPPMPMTCAKFRPLFAPGMPFSPMLPGASRLPMPSFLPYFTPLAPVFVPHTLPALALLPAPFPNVLSPFSNPATAREIEEATTVSSSNMHSLSSPASSSSTPISVHESEADEEEREIEALLRSCFEKPSAFVLPTSVPILDNCAPNPEWLWVLFHHLNEEFPYFMPSSDAFRACMRAHPALHELLEPLADLLDMNLDEAPQKHTYFLSREAKLSLAYRKYLPLAPLHIHILHFFLNFKREIDELCQTHHIGLTDALEVSLLALEQIDKRVIYRNESELHLSREYTSVFHALTFFMHRLVHEHRKAQCIFTKQVIGLL